jgi:hypothetical protein
MQVLVRTACSSSLVAQNLPRTLFSFAYAMLYMQATVKRVYGLI